MRFDGVRHDLRSAVRGFRQRPFTVVAAIGMLAMAVGISTAMFAIVDSLLLNPVPFPNAQQLGVIQLVAPNGRTDGGQPAAIRAWRATPAFTAVEASRTVTEVVATDAGEFTLPVAHVTPGIFEMLGGVRPVRGRLFESGEGSPGADDRAVISEDLWRARFGADEGLLSRPVTIDGARVRVVGILPADFRFPDWNTQVWRATGVDTPGNTWGTWPYVYVRRSVNVPAATAKQIAASAALGAGAGTPGTLARIEPLENEGLDEYYARAVPLLSAGVVLLFLVLCANVSSLLLGRLTARSHELATRAALGASRARLIRQAFLESALIGLMGLGGGMALAWALVTAASAILPDAALLHSLNPINFDWRALAIASVAGFIATTAAGVIPAIIGTRVDPNRSLQSVGRASTESTRARRATRVLLAGQIALSCLLLVGATALVRSFVNLMSADRGIDTRNILMSWVVLTDPALKTPEARAAAAKEIEDQARALPGVTNVAWSYGVPPRGAITLLGLWQPAGRASINLTASQSIVDAEFFPLYGIHMVRGRSFDAADPPNAVVISERLARSLFADANPVGSTVALDNQGSRPVQHLLLLVVGVVKDTRFPALDRSEDTPQLYTRYQTTSFTPMLSLRCAGPCPANGLVMRRLTEASPHVRIQDIGLVERVYFAQLARPRLAAALALIFAVTTLLAAAAGLFSLLTDAVSRRRREFGIRTALGASSGAVRRLVWREGASVTLAGIGLGAIGGVWSARALSALMYDVSVSDPMSWLIVSGVLVLTIAVAAWMPARHAASTSPLLLLRDE